MTFGPNSFGKRDSEIEAEPRLKSELRSWQEGERRSSESKAARRLFDKGFVRPGMISPEETLQKLGARRGLIKVEKCPPTPVPNQFWAVMYVPGREQVQINV